MLKAKVTIDIKMKTKTKDNYVASTASPPVVIKRDGGRWSSVGRVVLFMHANGATGIMGLWCVRSTQCCTSTASSRHTRTNHTVV